MDAPRNAVLAALLAAAASCGGEPESTPAESGGLDGRGAPAAPATGEPRSSGGVRLLARREIELGARPIGLVARDLDGDRYCDLVVVTQTPGTLAVLRGGPDGLVADGAPIALGGDFPLKPLDAGEHGFAVALQDTHELVWFADSSDLAEPRRIQLDAAPRALGVAASLRGAGLDALVADADGGLTAIRLGDDGPPPEAWDLPLDLHGRPTFALGIDGLPGVVVVGSQLDEALHVHTLGQAGAVDASRRIALGGIPRAATELDVDGDGDLELVVAGGDRSTWVLGLGKSGGHRAWFDEAGEAGATPLDLGAPGAIPLDLERADLDGDGRDELVLIDFYDSGYGVLGAFGSDGRPALVAKEYAGQDPVDGALGDFDGDGTLDLAVANRGALRVSLLLGSGFAEPGRVAFYQSPRVPLPQNPTRIAAANLDDDPLPEVVAICAGERVVAARTNRFGLLEPAGPTLARDVSAAALVAGARERSIALLAGAESGSRFALLAPASGGDGDAFAPVAPPVAVGRAGSLVALRRGEGLALIAVDADGRALFGLSDDGSAEPRRVPFDVEGGPLAACAVDVDGDGADELALATATGLHVLDATWKKRGGAQLGVPGHRPKALRSGDVNGDGRADLVVLYGGERDTAPGRIVVLTGDGAGGFARAAIEATGLAPAAIAVGDVDGDGRAEIFCAAQNSHNVGVWTPKGGQGEGGERLLVRLADVGAGLGPLDVQLVDLDGDGRLDLVTANNFSHDLSVAYNLSAR